MAVNQIVKEAKGVFGPFVQDHPLPPAQLAPSRPNKGA